MSPGDSVVYPKDWTLYGVGKIVEVLDPTEESAGRLRVDFDGDVDEFDAHELELASVWFKDFQEAA